ncbi:DNA helicase, partial [Tanacetum coccineum]
ESSSTGYSPSVSAQLFSSATTTTDTHSHSFNTAYQRMMHLIFFHKLLIKIFDPHDVPFYRIPPSFPPSTRYPRTSNRNVRSRSKRPVTNELATSSTTPAENIQRIDHGLPQSTYTRTKVDANESPPYRDLGLYDSISRGDREGVTVGGKIILPRSFTNGTRYLYSHYLDALAICRKLGNPQYFITFTCNVNWPEIKRYMEEFPQLTAADRPDIVCRVFE